METVIKPVTSSPLCCFSPRPSLQATRVSILLARPECFVKMLSYSNLSSPSVIKRPLEKLALQ